MARAPEEEWWAGLSVRTTDARRVLPRPEGPELCQTLRPEVVLTPAVSLRRSVGVQGFMVTEGRRPRGRAG
jgi:hypothetical protein